jgi:Putative metal-binding motif
MDGGGSEPTDSGAEDSGAGDSGDGGGGGSVDADGDGWEAALDCDDSDAAVYPSAPERCDDETDSNCDGDSTDGQGAFNGSLGFPSVQAAVDAAADGDTIAVCAGEQSGDVVVLRAVRLEGGDGVSLVGTGTSSVLTVFAAVELLDLVVSGGTGTARDDSLLGGGVLVEEGGSLRMEGGALRDNSADYGGGLLAAGPVELVDVQVYSNRAVKDGGGVYALADLQVEGGSISGNQADSGGGLLVREALLTLGEDVRVEANVADTLGGGAVLWAASLDGGVVAGNSAPNGGGVFLYEGASLSRTLIEGNTASWSGGGLHGIQGDVSLSSVVVTDNTADHFGGGMTIGGGAWLIEGCSVLANASEEGGGAWLSSGASLSSTSSDWSDNDPQDVWAADGSWTATGDFACDDTGCR